MGWRGAVRSISAQIRASEREALRRQKIQLKENERAYSAAAVDDWQQFIRDVTSLHAERSASVDWAEIAAKPKPTGSGPRYNRTEDAQLKLDDFKPRRFDFLRGGTAKRHQKLQARLEQAEKEDAAENAERARELSAAQDEWASEKALADRVLKRDFEAFRDVLSEYQSFSSVELIGSSMSFTINDAFLHCAVNVHDESLIPKVRKKQLASGKLSESKMPQGEFNELYQDYVCSVAIKVAADLFGMLPVSECYVTCQTHMLNSRTGHLEDTPILSVFFVKETLSKLRLSSIDPSDALANFVHQMKFKRTSGFERIEPLKS